MEATESFAPPEISFRKSLMLSPADAMSSLAFLAASATPLAVSSAAEVTSESTLESRSFHVVCVSISRISARWLSFVASARRS